MWAIKYCYMVMYALSSYKIVHTMAIREPQDEDIDHGSQIDEVIVSNNIRRAHSGGGVISEGNGSPAGPEGEVRDDEILRSQLNENDPLRGESLSSSNRFVQNREILANRSCDDDDSPGRLRSQESQSPRNQRSFLTPSSASDEKRSTDTRQNGGEAGQRSASGLGAVASVKNDAAHRRWSERILRGDGGPTFTGQMFERESYARQDLKRYQAAEPSPTRPTEYLAAENLYYRNRSYVNYEVYPPWLPRQRETAKAFVDPAPFVKAFSDDNVPHTSSSSSRVISPDRCVICKELLPYRYNGDTCCGCGGKICQICVKRRRNHRH